MDNKRKSRAIGVFSNRGVAGIEIQEVCGSHRAPVPEHSSSLGC